MHARAYADRGQKEGHSMPTDTLPRGYTVRELAKVLRVGPDRIRGWIRSGRLGAINTAERLARPRFVVLPHHLSEFERALAAGPPPKPPRRKKRTSLIDFYPD